MSFVLDDIISDFSASPPTVTALQVLRDWFALGRGLAEVEITLWNQGPTGTATLTVDMSESGTVPNVAAALTATVAAQSEGAVHFSGPLIPSHIRISASATVASQLAFRVRAARVVR